MSSPGFDAHCHQKGFLFFYFSSSSMIPYLREYTVKSKSTQVFNPLSMWQAQMANPEDAAPESLYIAQASLELPVFLSQPREYWGTGCANTPSWQPSPEAGAAGAQLTKEGSQASQTGRSEHRSSTGMQVIPPPFGDHRNRPGQRTG